MAKRKHALGQRVIRQYGRLGEMLLRALSAESKLDAAHLPHPCRGRRGARHFQRQNLSKTDGCHKNRLLWDHARNGRRVARAPRRHGTAKHACRSRRIIQRLSVPRLGCDTPRSITNPRTDSLFGAHGMNTCHGEEPGAYRVPSLRKCGRKSCLAR